MEGVINHGRAILRERKGYKEGVRVQAFFDKWGRAIVVGGLIAMVWAWSVVLAPQKFTEKEVRARNIEYLNYLYEQGTISVK